MNGAPNLPAKIRETVPMSPMHMPTVGILLCRVKLQHPQVVVRMVGHRGQLHDVRIEARQPAVHLCEIVGRLAKIVQADDPFRAAETGDRAGDVLLQVDVLHPFGNGRPQQQQPLLLACRRTCRHRPARRQVMTTGQGRSATSRRRLMSPLM